MSAKEKAIGSAGSSFVELVVIVAVALGLALGIQAVLVKPYRIPSESMVPTLDIGQRVLVNRASERLGGDPEVGDIVVFHPPKGSDDDTCGNADQRDGEACDRPTKQRSDVNFIKRVVAGPGDTLAVEEGHVILNGKRQKESFINDTCAGDIGRGCNMRRPIKVPADHWFMMGDNRGESDDSRFWGPVPRDWIIGNAFATYWPPKRLGLL